MKNVKPIFSSHSNSRFRPDAITPKTRQAVFFGNPTVYLTSFYRHGTLSCHLELWGTLTISPSSRIRLFLLWKSRQKGTCITHRNTLRSYLEYLHVEVWLSNERRRKGMRFFTVAVRHTRGNVLKARQVWLASEINATTELKDPPYRFSSSTWAFIFFNRMRINGLSSSSDTGETTTRNDK